MLSLATRRNYQTLLDARVLSHEADSQAAIIYLETGCEAITISRRQLHTMAQRYAAALQAQGIQAGDLVIIAYTQNLESIYAFWGALLLGAIPSMFPTLTEKLDPDVYMRNLSELVRFSDVRIVLSTDTFAPQLAQHVHCLVLGSSEITISGAYDAHQPEAETTAFLQHSSGTTGLQKGVALSHQAVLNQLASYSDSINLNRDDVIVSWLPLYHDMGLIAGFLLPLIQGIPLVLMSPFDWVKHPAMLLRAIRDYSGTLCWLPNFAYNHMARRIRKRDVEGVTLASMRTFINCSEPVRAASHHLFLGRFAAQGANKRMLAVSYAMAENTFAVTQTTVGKGPQHDVIDRRILEEKRQAIPVESGSENAMTLVSCGVPIANTQVKIMDADGKMLPERRVGEVIIRSDCMLTEYYKRPDIQPFVEGWYRSGDMGYIADAELYIIGRKKDLIINAGKNIYPQDIEAVVNTVTGVHPGRVVVFGVPDEREGTELIVVVAEIVPRFAADQKKIKLAIRQTVAQQTTATASFVQLVDARWLIKTSSGKIARAANREKWLKERRSK